MTKRLTDVPLVQEIRDFKKMVASLERTNAAQVRITEKALRLVLLKAVKGTSLTAVMNNTVKPVSLLSVADQYLEIN